MTTSPAEVPSGAVSTLHGIPILDSHCEALFLDVESACPDGRERAKVRRYTVRADPEGDHWGWWSAKDRAFTHAAYFLGLLDNALRHDKVRGGRILRLEEEQGRGRACKVSVVVESK